MSEKLIPISRKQHDAIQSLQEVITANQKQLTTVANVILLGQDETIERAGIIGARFIKGEDGSTGLGSPDLYVLVFEVPDIAPPADVKSA